MNLRTVIQWLLVIAVVSWVVSNPSGAAGLIVTVVSGVIDFFKALISGISSAV